MKDKNREGKTSNPIPNDHESHNGNEVKANASDRKSEATHVTGHSEALSHGSCADETHETQKEKKSRRKSRKSFTDEDVRELRPLRVDRPSLLLVLQANQNFHKRFFFIRPCYFDVSPAAYFPHPFAYFQTLGPELPLQSRFRTSEKAIAAPP